jgi:hypothetical protein
MAVAEMVAAMFSPTLLQQLRQLSLLPVATKPNVTSRCVPHHRATRRVLILWLVFVAEPSLAGGFRSLLWNAQTALTAARLQHIVKSKTAAYVQHVSNSKSMSEAPKKRRCIHYAQTQLT